MYDCFGYRVLMCQPMSAQWPHLAACVVLKSLIRILSPAGGLYIYTQQVRQMGATFIPPHVGWGRFGGRLVSSTT